MLWSLSNPAKCLLILPPKMVKLLLSFLIINDVDEIINAQGLIVSLGMIGVHVHISELEGIRSRWEGYITGTKACAKGAPRM